jgi:predicted small secreted protein
VRLSKVAITLFFALSFLLTGCANGTSSIGEISEREDKQVSLVGTEGQLIPIQSDNVRAAGYDVETQVMTVQFKNGYLYEYYGVSADVWTSFIAAQPNPWSQVGYPRLVQSGIPYKRIG